MMINIIFIGLLKLQFQPPCENKYRTQNLTVIVMLTKYLLKYKFMVSPDCVMCTEYFLQYKFMALTCVMRNLFLSSCTSIIPPFSLCLLRSLDISSCQLLNSAVGLKFKDWSAGVVSHLKRSTLHSISSRHTGQGTQKSTHQGTYYTEI